MAEPTKRNDANKDKEVGKALDTLIGSLKDAGVEVGKTAATLNDVTLDLKQISANNNDIESAQCHTMNEYKKVINEAVKSLGATFDDLDEVTQEDLKIKYANVDGEKEYLERQQKILEMQDELRRKAEEAIESERDRKKKEEAREKAKDIATSLLGGKFEDSGINKFLSNISGGLGDAKAMISSVFSGISESTIGTIVGSVAGPLGKILTDGLSFIGDKLDSFVTGLSAEIDKMADQYNKSSELQARYIEDSRGNVFNWAEVIEQSRNAAQYLYDQADYLNQYEELIKKGFQDTSEITLETYAHNLMIADMMGTTFDQTSDTFVRLMKIQNEQTLTTRMGLESSLNAYLTQLTENTRYLNSLYESVMSNLYEAETQMTATDAVNLEAVIQEWLGVMYGSGMSDSFITNISSSLNSIATGDISNISSSTGLLLTMAAANAGLDYSSILNSGLNAASAGSLLASLVQVLSSANDNDSNIVRKQLASMYGANLADLTVAGQIVSNGTYDSMLNEYSPITAQNANEAYTTAVSAMTANMTPYEMLQNVMSNFKNSIGAAVATSPLDYYQYQIGGLLGGNIVGQAMQLGAISSGLAAASAQVAEATDLGDELDAKIGIEIFSKLSSLFEVVEVIAKSVAWLNDKIQTFVVTMVNEGIWSAFKSLIGL